MESLSLNTQYVDFKNTRDFFRPSKLLICNVVDTTTLEDRSITLQFDEEGVILSGNSTIKSPIQELIAKTEDKVDDIKKIYHSHNAISAIPTFGPEEFITVNETGIANPLANASKIDKEISIKEGNGLWFIETFLDNFYPTGGTLSLRPRKILYKRHQVDGDAESFHDTFEEFLSRYSPNHVMVLKLKSWLNDLGMSGRHFSRNLQYMRPNGFSKDKKHVYHEGSKVEWSVVNFIKLLLLLTLFYILQ